MTSGQNQLANLIAQRFIARKDIKAQQWSSGGYSPVKSKWTRADIYDHLTGGKTYGHYLLNPDSQCKLFCFDVDIRKTHPEQNIYWPLPSLYDEDGWPTSFYYGLDARAEWLNRRSMHRAWFKRQFHKIGHELAAGIERTLHIPSAVAYTGSKGIHVYGFTGLKDAYMAREGAVIVLDTLGKFEPANNVFWHYKNKDPFYSYPQFDIEVFPKQDAIDGKEGLGNLLRLPLGVNQKAVNEPTFFVDMTAALNTLQPIDPVFALTTDSAFVRPGELNDN